MIRDVLQTIMDMYSDARTESFSSNPVADYLRHEAPEEIFKSLHVSNLICKGSAGQSRWADVPWIGIFDPIVTTSATRGYYLVYLFSADMERVFLCLGQGTTAIRHEFGSHTHDELRRRSALICSRLSDVSHSFSSGDIALNGSSQLADDYEQAKALYVEYSANDLPSEPQLEADLNNAVGLYLRLTARGGVGTFEDDVTSDTDTEESDNIIEKRRYRYHRKIERNQKASKAAKKVHGYKCQACGFDFEETFGEIGSNYIEAHHLTPLSELPEEVTVALNPRTDFAVLCANCHRMIHRKQAPKSVEGLRSLIMT